VWECSSGEGQVSGEDVEGSEALLSQGADAKAVMSLCEAAAIVVDNELAVEPGGEREAEGAVQENLSGGGLEQVGAADDFRDAHEVIVDDAGELVAGDAVATPDDEVAEVDACGEAQRAQVLVVEGDDLAVGDTEAPVEAEGVGVWNGGQAIGRAAGAGIDRLIVGVGGRFSWGGFMRRGEGGGEILAGTAAGVEVAPIEESLPGVSIDGAALALEIGLAGAADVGSLMPADAESEEILNGGGGEFSAAALGVEVFHAEDECAVGIAGALKGLPECAGVADVEISGG
jgi:hypothetical protein